MGLLWLFAGLFPVLSLYQYIFSDPTYVHPRKKGSHIESPP